MSELLALGVSHKTAPLDLRERLSLTEGRAVGALHEIAAASGIHEAAAISTCNRTELYLVVSDPVEAESTALGVLTRQAEIRPTELLGHLYSLRAGEAAHHPFQATAGPAPRCGRGAGAPRGRSSTASSAARSPPAGGCARRRRSARKTSRSPRSPSIWP